MDDTPMFFDSVNEETATNIAAFWGCLTTEQIKEYVRQFEENEPIDINPIEVH
jgi:hypothetical protein